MDEFSLKWNSGIERIRKAAGPIVGRTATTCDVSDDMVELMGEFADFFYISTLTPAHERVLFCAFLWLHNVYLSRFQFAPQGDVDFVYLWAQFNSIFKSVSSALLPFRFNEHFSKLYLALNFFQREPAAGENARAISAAFSRFAEKAELLSSVDVTVEAFEAALNEFQKMKSLIYQTCRAASPEGSDEELLPGEMFGQFSSCEFVMNFGLLFVRIKETIERINAAISGRQHVLLKVPESEGTLKEFLVSSLKIFLLENRLMLSKDNDWDSRSAEKGRDDVAEVDKALEKESEIIHEILAVLSVNNDRARISQLWKQCFEVRAKVKIKSETKLESVAVEKLGNLIQCFLYDNLVLLHKYEEFKRIFTCLTKDTTVFSTITHCMILLMEIRSMAQNDQVVRAVDEVVLKLTRRINLSKFKNDSLRILWVLRAFHQFVSEPVTIESRLGLLKKHVEALSSMGMFPRGGSKSQFLSLYHYYLDILSILAKDGGEVPAEFVKYHPSAKVLLKAIISHPDFALTFREFAMSGKYASLVMPVCEGKSGHLDLAEFQHFATLCEREVWQGHNMHKQLLKFSAVVYFIQQVQAFKSGSTEEIELTPREDHDVALQGLFDETSENIMTLLLQDELFTSEERREMALLVGKMTLFLMFNSCDTWDVSSVASELYQSFCVPRCQSLLRACYRVLDYITELSDVYPTITETVNEIRSCFMSCFKGEFKGYYDVKRSTRQLVEECRFVNADLAERVQRDVSRIEKFLILAHFLSKIESVFITCGDQELLGFVRIFVQVNHLRLISDELSRASKLGIPVNDVDTWQTTLAATLEANAFSKFARMDLGNMIQEIDIAMPHLSSFLISKFRQVRQELLDVIECAPVQGDTVFSVDFDDVVTNLRQYMKTEDRVYLLHTLMTLKRCRSGSDKNTELTMFRRISEEFMMAVRTGYALVQLRSYPITELKRHTSDDSPIASLLSRLQQEVDSLSGQEQQKSFIHNAIDDLKAGPICKVFSDIAAGTQAGLFELELAEIRQMYGKAEKELQGLHQQKTMMQSVGDLKEAVALLAERNKQNDLAVQNETKHASELAERLTKLHNVIAHRFTAQQGVPRFPAAIEKLLRDDNFPQRLVAEDRQPIDDLEDRLREETIMNTRLKREVERLALPQGESHIPQGALKEMMAELTSLADADDWRNPVESETVALKAELKKMYKERGVLFRTLAGRTKPLPRPSPEALAQEIDRLTDELFRAPEGFPAHPQNLRSFICTFSAKADQLFSLMKLEQRILHDPVEAPTTEEQNT